jgi:hypothetical protein
MPTHFPDPSVVRPDVQSRLLTFLRLLLTARAALIAENLFLRKQLAFFKERKVKPRRITRAARLTMIALARFFDWRDALAIVKPATFIKWHRAVFRMFWRWKSRKRGRPALPQNPPRGNSGQRWSSVAKTGTVTLFRREESSIESLRPVGEIG